MTMMLLLGTRLHGDGFGQTGRDHSAYLHGSAGTISCVRFCMERMKQLLVSM